ncbi:MAG: hypothetical protein DI604_25035 [Delftia acidovorans]|nr:MAG: hypothetical protein DI604_25035 [Delftia acidovorans]
MRFFAALCLLAVSNTAVNAEWLFHQKASAFLDEKETFVSAQAEGNSLAFRCDRKEVQAVFFVSNASPVTKPGQLAIGTLLFRVDDRPTVTALGRSDARDGGVRVSARVESSFLEDVRQAKKRLAVAILADEGLLHETSYSVDGVKRVLTQFIQACPVASQY